MKRKYYYRIMYAVLVLLLAQNLQAQHYNANVQLAIKALNLNLDSILMDAQQGTMQLTGKAQKLTLRINKNHQVEHIGIPLFNPYIRVLQPSPIYDYLEYAVLDHKFHISESDLQLQQLKFQKGDWKDLENLNDTMMCTVSNVEDKYYVVTWYNGDQEYVTVNFPISYELLANSNRKEILEKFITSLKQFRTEEKIKSDIDTTQLKPYDIDGIYILKGDFYTLPEINTDIFFRQMSEDGDNRYELLMDRRLPVETLANRLLLPGSCPGDPMMTIACYLYNHRKETVTTTLSNWMVFCQQNGCKAYFGFEHNHDGLLTSTLIMRNRDSGYDHILTIKCQQNQLESEDLQLDVTAYLYAPSTNVSDLFHQSDKTSQKRNFIMQ